MTKKTYTGKGGQTWEWGRNSGNYSSTKETS